MASTPAHQLLAHGGEGWPVGLDGGSRLENLGREGLEEAEEWLGCVGFGPGGVVMVWQGGAVWDGVGGLLGW